ncbi:MAG: hypothetical protein ACRCU5_09490, partial [Rhizobiaceae bacterium]
MSTSSEKPTGLALMRAPFAPHQISKLPKPTRAQTDEVKANFKAGIRCALCGAWHHPKVEHLDYVGHAALTDRLLDCDPEWNWQPVSTNDKMLPATDQNGGMWIKLTVCGVTRLGYGCADGKTGGDAVKELIGDALRNAAMRFGAALDLWHKGDLHATDGDPPTSNDRHSAPPAEPARDPAKIADGIIAVFSRVATIEALDSSIAESTKLAEAWDWLALNDKSQTARVKAAYDSKREELNKPAQEEAPY